MELGHLGVIADQRLAQGGVKSVNRAIAFGGGVLNFTIHAYFDGCFGKGAAPAAVLHRYRIIDHLEGHVIAGLLAFEHQHHRGFGGIERKALRFEQLDLGQHGGNVAAPVRFQPIFLGFTDQVAAPRQL